ncbi:helix-turn-helix domain-containing protein [Streptomyces olivaceiscleroticus]|uniref:Helix-turn-helix domain-containing protein n=1 Tax=Streptomyces olivaceiscleroticus TaxID=68245 RepID=A0ABP3J6F7_9ACTN
MPLTSSTLVTTQDRRPLANPEELSDFLGVPVKTLYQWRHRGIGPKGTKVGRHIRYRWKEVEAWLDSQTDPHAG